MADPKSIREIIVDGNPDVLIKEAEELGQKLARADLKKSQVRNIYATVKQVEVTGKYSDQERRRVMLLIPRLQYLSAREPNLAPLSGVLTACIQELAKAPSEEQAKRQFGHFADFFEAIVAYHYASSTRGRA